jgi:hypothetical protein
MVPGAASDRSFSTRGDRRALSGRLARVHEDTATGLLRPGRRLEDIVSKRRDLPYRSRRCRAWIKVKNPASPAELRIRDGTW